MACLDIVLGNRPTRYGPQFQVAVSRDGREFRPARRAVEASPYVERQVTALDYGARRPLLVRLVLRDPDKIGFVQVSQVGKRPDPLSISELRLFELRAD